MVDEFSAFARMPQPAMEAGSLYDLVAGQIKLFESKKLEIAMEVDNSQSDYVIICDLGLMRQAVTTITECAGKFARTSCEITEYQIVVAGD